MAKQNTSTKLNFLAAASLVAIAAAGCSMNNEFTLKGNPPPNAQWVEIIKVVTPDTFIAKLLPETELEQMDIDDIDDIGDAVLLDNPYNVIIHMADLDVPMSQYQCDEAWSNNYFIQGIKHLMKGHNADTYGIDKFSFDQLCDRQEKVFVGAAYSVTIDKLDVKNRIIIGTLVRDGKDQNLMMIEEGLARYDHLKGHRLSYRVAEAKAMRDKKGLWNLAPTECGFSINRALRCKKYHYLINHPSFTSTDSDRSL